MGFSWAFWIAQRVHQHIALRGSGLSPQRLLVDAAPAPDLCCAEPLMLPYCDNLNLAGTSVLPVQQALERSILALESHGFDVHERVDATLQVESLGYCIDGESGLVSIRPAKLALHIPAWRWISSRPRISGRALERMLGHLVPFLLLRREFLALPAALYSFAQRMKGRRARLWPSAAQEARWIATLLPLVCSDLRMPWSAQLTMSDASLTGFAVCSSRASPEVCAGLGRQAERARYRVAQPRPAARASALAWRDAAVPSRDPFADIETVKTCVGAIHPDTGLCILDVHASDLEPNPEFNEVPLELLASDQWSFRFASPVLYSEPIGALEALGVLAGLRHKLRATCQFGLRHVHIGDNLGLTLALGKGRAHPYRWLRIFRKILCLAIATRSRFYHRWIPSELNQADHGSRLWEPGGPLHAALARRRATACKSPAASRAPEGAASLPHEGRAQSSPHGLAAREGSQPARHSRASGPTGHAGRPIASGGAGRQPRGSHALPRDRRSPDRLRGGNGPLFGLARQRGDLHA